MIDENDTDWLIDYFRRQNQTEESLAPGYFSIVSSNLNHIDQNPLFFRFLQFFSFSRTQRATTEIFWEQPYSIVQFKVTDFIYFIQISNKNNISLKKECPVI